MEFKPGARIQNVNSGRMAFVLYASNTGADIVVRFDGFEHNSLINPGNSFRILPDEPFRK